MFLTIILFLVTLIVLSHFYFQYVYNYWKKRNIPYVKPIPLFGNLLPILTLKRQISLWFQDQYRAFDSDYFGIFGLTTPILVVKSPKLSTLQMDINDDTHNIQSVSPGVDVIDIKCSTVSKHDKVTGNMLFVRNNPSWKRVRTKVSPAFTPGKVKQMFPFIQDEMDKFIEHIKENLVNNEWTSDMKCLTAKFTINLIVKCAIGVNINTFENDQSQFWVVGNQLFDCSFSTRFRIFAARFLPLLIKLFDIRAFRPKTLENFSNLMISIFHEREKLNDNNPDLVNILIQLKKKHPDDSDFTNSGLVGVVLNYFAAGYETTAGIYAFALYELAIAPDLQELLRKEIFETMAKYDNKITYEGINEMKYLDMIVSETLRKYPSLPFLDRQCNQDYKFKDTDFVIEKGTSVYVPLLGLHYDEKYFPNPEKFDPERFRNKDDINKDGLYYMPFGEGPRNCLGGRFGLISVKLGVATIMSNFKLSKAPTTPVPVVFHKKATTLNSSVGLPLTLTAL